MNSFDSILESYFQAINESLGSGGLNLASVVDVVTTSQFDDEYLNIGETNPDDYPQLEEFYKKMFELARRNLKKAEEEKKAASGQLVSKRDPSLDKNVVSRLKAAEALKKTQELLKQQGVIDVNLIPHENDPTEVDPIKDESVPISFPKPFERKHTTSYLRYDGGFASKLMKDHVAEGVDFSNLHYHPDSPLIVYEVRKAQPSMHVVMTQYPSKKVEGKIVVVLLHVFSVKKIYDYFLTLMRSEDAKKTLNR